MSTAPAATISLQQIYQAIKGPRPKGMRVLTDGLWPRGLSKATLEKEQIIWYRGASPATELRQGFHQQQITAEQFDERYRAQLRADAEQLAPLLEYVRNGPLVLLTAMKDPEHTYLSQLRDELIAALK